MKSPLFLSLLACVLVLSKANAETIQQFNSNPSTPLTQVKAALQSHCWYFPGFDVNNGGWAPAIEGDGAMVSGISCTSTQNAGIYTPLLDVAGNVNVSFKYKLNNCFNSGTRRWIKIYLTDYDNNIQMRLDSMEVNGANAATCVYSKDFPAGSGCYKVFINYQGTGGTNCIAVDDLNISTSLLFAGGCAQTPGAINDKLNGAANGYASGNVLLNDIYPAVTSSVYLVTNSVHGNVTLNDDGTFNFAPNAGFTGPSTTFAYKICDNSICSPICSDDATVSIDFPTSGFLPVSLIDFMGLYKNDGNVEIDWTTTAEQNTDRFEVERSLDGSHWQTTGKVKGQGVSSVKHAYSFTDNVGRNTANKKDLYYRLKQIDLDDKISTSRILVVRVYNTHSLKMISVTPNPARNDIAANIQLSEPSIVVLKIMTASGNEMMKKTLKLGEGSNNILMDGTNKLTPGMYFLEVVINSKERMIVKLIKE